MRDTRKLRVLGGPHHGRVETAPRDQQRAHLRVCLPDRSYAYMSGYDDYPPPHAPAFKTYEYESRKVMLGPMCAVEVLCAPNLTDNEMMRLLADVIENGR